jgi:hypothetical protein
VDTSEIRSQISGNVVLENNGEHKMDRSCGSEEVLRGVKAERNILHAIKRRKANWIGHILRRNCLLKHVIEGKVEGRIEVMERRERRRKQLLADHRESRGY